MRKAFKNPASKIVTEELKHIPGNSANNKKIANILLKEQKFFCAYTDELISRTDAKDIEHFNPQLKATEEDNYNNWFIVKHQWNLEKSSKWDDSQPVLHPTAPDFEERVIYLDGDYTVKSGEDIEANHLIRLLQLDDPALAENRKKYIERKRSEMIAYGQDAVTFFTILLEQDPVRVSYPRAIKEVFGVDIWEMMPDLES
jgi:hypothetical protein